MSDAAFNTRRTNMPARPSRSEKAEETAITVRLPRNLLKRIDRWIAGQGAPVSRAEAIRRLAGSGLDRAAVSSAPGTSGRGAEKAAGMANEMIDYLADRSATHEDREQRKRRLVKGPSEFLEMRKKHTRRKK